MRSKLFDAIIMRWFCRATWINGGGLVTRRSGPCEVLRRSLDWRRAAWVLPTMLVQARG
jgi:hypothetical protein